VSFIERDIDVVFDLANGQFLGGGNSYTVTGLRVQCKIVATGGPFISSAEITIYGMPLQLMNQLSTIGSQWSQRGNNKISVFANGSLVFSGAIFNAFVDAAQQPQVCFRVIASPGAYQSVVPLDPISIQGSADAAQLMSQLASKMGFQFENNGVNVKLSNPYYDGSPWQAAVELAQHGNFDLTVERGVLIISPFGSPRQGATVLVSADTGMKGYPAFVQNGLVVEALFDPTVKLLGLIEVQSTLSPANGVWQVRKVEYDLESITPGGPWFMTLETNPVGTKL